MRTNYLPTLDQGIALVTPSRRLSGLVADRYHTEQQRTDLRTWVAPRVLPFSAWISESFQQLALSGHPEFLSRVLLNADQERFLWEQVISDSGDVEFDQAGNLAALAMNAWSTAMLWKIPLPRLTRSAVREESRALARWCMKFQERCRDLEVIDHSQFAADLGSMNAENLARLDRFEFFGYTRLPTVLSDIRRLTTRNGTDANASAAKQVKNPEYRAYPNFEAEIDAALEWSAAKRMESPRSDVVIALANPNLIDAGALQRLQRVLAIATHGASGEAQLTLGSSGNAPFVDLPMIKFALLLLDAQRARPWDEISQLLISPYFGEAHVECDQRALLDVELRRHGDMEITMSWVIEAARAAGSCGMFIRRIEGIASALDGAPKRQRLHDWMRTVDEMLAAAGWPGEAALGDHEQLAFLEWQRTLDSLAQLDAVVPPCTWDQMLGHLRSVLRGRRQPTADAIDAIQLVTLQEASFLGADELWLADLHDGAWPALNETNPLLPSKLQRDFAVPGADPERDLLEAERLLNRLRQQHPNAIWSFARADGETQRRALGEFEFRVVASEGMTYWPQTPSSTRFERFPDSHALTLDASQNMRGGVGLFTDQAACPMRAVARHRLHSETPADATPGLNPLQRGNLIHAVMASFWTETTSSDELQRMDDQQLLDVTRRCVDAVVEDFRRRYRFIDTYWELESQRLVELASEWLVQEFKRGPFKVVACEQSRVTNVGRFVINTRVDRVDQLPNGTQLVIDYKTGAVVRSGWDLPRLDQPQLPIYAASARAHERIAGIAYAGIKKGQCRFVDEPRGAGLEAPSSAETQADWQSETDAWRRELEALAGEIQDGFAITNPKRGAATCNYCDLHVLCRIHERGRSGADDDAADE